jgi:hypothetical protein
MPPDGASGGMRLIFRLYFLEAYATITAKVRAKRPTAPAK